MKIVVIAPESVPVPPVRGGAIQAGIEEDTGRFTGHEVVVLGPADPLLPREEWRGHVAHRRYQAGLVARALCSTYRLPFRSGNSRWSAWPYARWCARQVRRLQPDAIYVHSRPQFIPALKQAWPAAKIILHVSQASTLALDRVWDAALCSQIDLVVGVSDFIAREATRRHPALAGRVVSRIRGLDTRALRPAWELPRLREAIRGRYGIAPHEVVLLYVGRLAENKGAHVAIETLARLHARGARQVKLFIVGGEPLGATRDTADARRLQSVARSAEGAVCFTGFVPPHRVPELLLMSDVLVVPSLVEDACPRVVLEAMAAGVPVVAFRRGGIPELVEDGVTGRLVDPAAGAEGLAAALEPLRSHAAVRLAMGRAARERTEQRFDAEATARQLLASLERVQANGRQGAHPPQGASPRTILYCETGTGFGGSGRSLHQLLVGLNRSKFRPIVVVSRDGGVTDAIRALGIPVHLLPSPQIESTGYLRLIAHAMRHELPRLARLIRLIRRERVSALHLNNDVYSNMAGLLAARLTGRPACCHLRLTRAPTRIERWLGRLATVKIVLTEEAIGFYQRYWPHDRLVCIPNGVEVPPEPLLAGAAARRSLGLPETQPVVGFIARCIPRKGYEEVLQAAAFLRRRRPEVRFVIFGNGPGGDEAYEARMRRLATELSLSGEVLWAGWQRDPAVIYGAPDIVVQASTTFPEGLSRVVLEAMAYGKPVVATRIVGNREAVIDGQTGLLVEPGDAEALAGALEALLADREAAARYGRQGRQRVAAQFSLRAHADRMAQLYERVLATGQADA